jgi:hypothetical protein
MDTTSPIRWSWSSTCFWTAGKHLIATVVMASYGFQFGSFTTPWKDHQVYFETDPSSCGYLIRVGRIHWFYIEMYSINGESVPICFYWWFWNRLKRYVEVQRSSKGGPAKLESQSKSSWNPIQNPETVRTKIIAQITYQLRFGRSLYEWKDKRINISMEPVSYQNSFWIHGKRRNNEAHKIYHGAVLPYLGPVGYVSSWAQ